MKDIIFTVVIFTSAFFELVASQKQVTEHLGYEKLQDPDADLYVTLRQPFNSTVKGHYLQSFAGRRYYAFQDIPYAVPPVGVRRFKEAEPTRPWKGIFDATNSTKQCIQVYGNITFGDEDCLVVNVYTPVNPSNTTKLLPVLFWIHGGAFIAGSGIYAIYNPSYFMDEDIVVVTINYRLGIRGFLTTEDSAIPTNLGLKDQRLALEWTHINIDKFGGDPNNVTIMGESAGAGSVGYHLLDNYTKPLFSGAVLASGTSLAPWTRQINAREKAFRVGKKINRNFNSRNSYDLLRVLQNVTASNLLMICSAEQSEVNWIDVLPNDTYYYRPPTDAVDNGNIVRVPIMVGFNSEEMLPVEPYSTHQSVVENARKFDQFPKEMLGILDVGRNNATLVALELKKLYTKGQFVNDLPALIRFNSDFAFTTASIRHAESASRYVPTYLYQFSFQSSVAERSVIPGTNGTYHAEDLAFYWYNALMKIPEKERYIARRFVRMLTNFVKYRNPMPTKDPLFKNITWPKVMPNNVRYLNFGEHFSIGSDPRNYSTIKPILDSNLIKPVYVY